MMVWLFRLMLLRKVWNFIRGNSNNRRGTNYRGA